jgi:hypothetical protein
MSGMTEIISLAQFQEELWHITRFDVSEPVANPLSAAVQQITRNPALAQARLLGRMLRALTDECGEFRRAEVSAFDTATLRLLVALMKAARAGTYTRAEWVDAITAADSATSR